MRDIIREVNNGGDKRIFHLNGDRSGINARRSDDIFDPYRSFAAHVQ